eukprot:TRINITY_DN8056_c2_g3_i1.p1 TRINITY_DN8056_c2_g3~~TRINITY_DN8056_c2_g3_i1.p1  ORF type:complete len:484 (-),score=183.20 TRINITY_DN8056_c2_g3_i1:198-1649(-)
MKCKGNRKSKKQKLSLKYNIQKRVREKKRRMKKEAKKLGLRKKIKKDPGIPNSWPFKAEMLAQIEKQKEKKDAEMAKKRAEAKSKAVKDKKETFLEQQKAHRAREEERRRKRAEQVELSQLDALRKLILKADVYVQVLDARDPLGCRCPDLEAYAQENGKRLVFALAKSDLVPAQTSARWIQFLGHVAPTVVVSAEAGREGIPELIRALGHAPTAAQGSATAKAIPGVAAASAVALLGYAGTGKKTLSKAIRKDCSGASDWLLEGLGRLRPAEDLEGEAGVAAALHLAIRGSLPKGTAQPAEPIEVTKLYLERAGKTALMRRYRLAAFEDASGFVKAWATDKKLKTKKGKDPTPETAALRFVAEMGTAPGVACAPPDAPLAGAVNLWSVHGPSKGALEAAMTAQAQLLGSRDASSGPSAGCVLCASGSSLGQEIALKELMDGDEVGSGGEDDDMDDDDMLEGGFEEGEEEEDFDEDDEMDDDE